MTSRVYNAFSLILLLQFLTIVAGTLLTSAALKIHGYPDSEIMIWNPVSVFIRNWGWVAIIIPAILYLLLYQQASSRGETLEDKPYVILAVLATFLNVLFYAYTGISAAQRKKIPLRNVVIVINQPNEIQTNTEQIEVAKPYGAFPVKFYDNYNH